MYTSSAWAATRRAEAEANALAGYGVIPDREVSADLSVSHHRSRGMEGGRTRPSMAAAVRR